jgi:hypothetical protein
MRSPNERRNRLIRLALLGFSLCLLMMPLIGARAAEPGNGAFQRTWQRTDQPVRDGRSARTWMWGPEGFTGLMSEPYADAPGGMRTVQYFDKARMEITDPGADQNSIWYVTNGLLVTELISGNMQIAETTFEQRSPAMINVAGDFDDPSGPTYATFTGLLERAPHPAGATVTERLSRAGTITDDPALAGQGVTIGAIDEITIHAIAKPFWEFMNSSGPVYADGQISSAALFENPYFATGRPITEA